MIVEMVDEKDEDGESEEEEDLLALLYQQQISRLRITPS